MKLTLTILAIAASLVVVVAQDAIVIPVAAPDTTRLAQKYAAFEKAKTEWESARAEAVKHYGTDKTLCGLKFSPDFKFAVPDVCPSLPSSLWNTPVNGGSITLTHDNSWR
jgi:hypothetical protein